MAFFSFFMTLSSDTNFRLLVLSFGTASGRCQNLKVLVLSGSFQQNIENHPRSHAETLNEDVSIFYVPGLALCILVLCE